MNFTRSPNSPPPVVQTTEEKDDILSGTDRVVGYCLELSLFLRVLSDTFGTRIFYMALSLVFVLIICQQLVDKTAMG